MRVRNLNLETLCQSPFCFVDSISDFSLGALVWFFLGFGKSPLIKFLKGKELSGFE